MSIAVPSAVSGLWQQLAGKGSVMASYEPSMTKGLPEPARRWLEHSITSGTPLWRSVELDMRGDIKLGMQWQPFRARQILSPGEGFIWAARSRLFGLPITGFDRFSAGQGQMRWKLLNIIPVLSASGADVARSAAGRLAAESVLLPTAFQTAGWSPGSDKDVVTMSRVINGAEEKVNLRLTAQGQLAEVWMMRWGNPGGEKPGRYPFGVAIMEEKEFSGITLPSVLRAGWWWGTPNQGDGEFFHARITGALFR